VSAGVFSINAFVIKTVDDKIIAADEACRLTDVDCIIILGCRVYSDGTLSHMLNDRMEVGTALYFDMSEKGSYTKILVSGDHGTAEYNEVEAMKQFAVSNGIQSSDVFMDHAGFSTYESIYRAKEIFGAKKIVIVTQKYHLYRALYVAEALGVEAYGVSADLRSYRGQIKYDLREILARNKDFLSAIFKPEPTYLGDKISLDGSGDATNDH
jgi:vancomycin permeability regulator SanA